ncbi:hypothetical protein BH11ARM2_BH11ARM2_21080 [soil metagenome]
MREKRSDDEIEDMDFGDAVIALALPSAAMALVESTIFLITRRLFDGSDIAIFTLLHGHLLLIPVVALVTLWLGRLGRQGLLAAAAGWSIAFFLAYHFRGAHTWDGTFDVFDRDARYWQLAIAIGYLAGATSVWAFPKRTGGSHYGWSVGVMAASTLAMWLDAHSRTNTSFFAPTRHLALLTLLGIVLAAWATDALRSRFIHEERVHTH